MKRYLLLLISMFLCGCAITPSKPIALNNITTTGELRTRINLNLQRMNDAYYAPAALAKISPDWPADATGRAILALTMLGQATHTDPPRLKQLMDGLPAQMNHRGYIEPPRGSGTLVPLLDEQQLSGHSWLLRGLCEHYRWKHDPQSLAIIQTIVQNLLLPARGNYSHYVTDPVQRIHQGNVAGNITNVVNGWKLSSDIGCAFMMIDGATNAYEILPSPELRAVILEMIARYERTDLVKLGAQTHATLSAARGILRFYFIEHDPRFLRLAQHIYAIYRAQAMTETYANYNWFGRPEWTEACAVIDSFMLATQLWQYTGDTKYLEDAHLIYFNAMSHAQRPNGGFGCDLCVGTNGQTILAPHEIYEAPFCCSMRGGEGLARAAQYSCFVGHRSITLPFLNDCTIHTRDIDLEVSTQYPSGEETTVTIKRCDQIVSLRIFCPSWADEHNLTLEINGRRSALQLRQSFIEMKEHFAAGDVIRITMPMPRRTELALRPDLMPAYHRFFQGPLLLGDDSTGTLSPIDRLTFMSDEQARKSRDEVLFR